MAAADLDEAIFEIGRRLLELAEQSREWIARRIEHVEFDDHQAMRKVTILDLTFEDGAVEGLPRYRGRTVLPIKLIRREVDLDATVFDLDGRALPQLNRRLERTLVAAGLVATTWPEESLGSRVRLAQWVRHHLDPTSFRRPSVAPPRARFAALGERLDRYRAHRLLIAALDLPPQNDTGAILRVTVAQSEVVPLDVERTVEGGSDRVRPVRRLVNVLRHPVAEMRTFFEAELTWEQLAVATTDDLVLDLQLDEAAGCESFHFELVAPPGLLVKSALCHIESVTVAQQRRFADIKNRLSVLDRRADTEEIARCYEEIRALAAGVRVRELRDDDVHYDRVHLFTSLDREEEVTESAAEVLLRPMTLGMTRPLLYSSALAAFVLTALWLTTGWAGAPQWLPRILEIQYDLDRQSVVALLLLGPTLFLAIGIRDREHLMTKRVLERHRRRLVIQAVLTFFTAGVYAVGPSTASRWWLGLPVVVASVALSSVDVRSYLRSWRTLRAQEKLSHLQRQPIGGG